MKDCKPGKIRNPATNRCASPERLNHKVKPTVNQLHPDIKRENGRCVHITNLNNLSLVEMKNMLCFYEIEIPTRATKKSMIARLIRSVGGENEVHVPQKSCPRGSEINILNGRCRKSCTNLQIRHPKTHRCRSK